MAVIAAEDGTPLLNEAEIAARWETIFFHEFSGRGERAQPKDVESRLRELRIPWQAQLRPEEWPDEDRLAADACGALGKVRNGKAMGEDCVPTEYLCAAGQGHQRALRGWLSGHSRKGCRADVAQVAWFQCPKSRECH